MKIFKPKAAQMNTLAMETTGIKQFWQKGKPIRQRVTFDIRCTSEDGESIAIGEMNRADKDALQYVFSVAEVEELIRQTRANRKEGAE
ncbi:hypothetical protein FACS1894208_05310 [Clostridia bacterium]|nr:hypothetical protein FACS1894208_05310 [Clostridia bacterium]